MALDDRFSIFLNKFKASKFILLDIRLTVEI